MEWAGLKVSHRTQNLLLRFQETILDAEDAIAEGLGSAGTWIIRHQLQGLRYELRQTLKNQKSHHELWQRKAREGLRRGHAAFSNSWLDHWDDAWAVRRDNGKGWKVGNKELLAALPEHIIQPDRSTITRQRQKRHKELNP